MDFAVVEEMTRWAQSLDDEQLERTLRAAILERNYPQADALRMEARQRFAGKLGLPPALMEDDRG